MSSAHDKQLHDALQEWFDQSDGITVGLPSELVHALLARLADVPAQSRSYIAGVNLPPTYPRPPAPPRPPGARGLRPCRSPYCECEQGKCTHPGCCDARGVGGLDPAKFFTAGAKDAQAMADAVGVAGGVSDGVGQFQRVTGTLPNGEATYRFADGVPVVPASGPLRDLGAYLARVLDEDQWAHAEALLLKATDGVGAVALTITEGGLWALIHKDFPFANDRWEKLLTFGQIKVVVERALAHGVGGTDGR